MCGFAPNLESNTEGFELIIEAIKKAGYIPGEDVNIAYSFIKEMFCKVCKQSLLFSNSKYDIIEYPFLFRERQLDSVVLPIISSLCKGLVIAEYPIVRDSSIKGFEKKDSKGRIDYWCIYKDYSLVIEMKHSYDALRQFQLSYHHLVQINILL